MSTLSVETSSSGSSASTVSPTSLSHWVTVPSVTDSPSSGMATSLEEPEDCFSPFGSSFLGSSLSAFSSEEASSASPESPSSVAESEPEESSESGVSPSSPSTAITAPTSTSSSSSTLISRRTPEAGEGTSVSTLSVDTSRRGSSASTVSPTSFNHWVTVPSVTDSPSSGISTENAIDKTPLNVVLATENR